MRLVKKEGKLMVELPEVFEGKKVKAIKIDDETILLTTEEKFRELLGRQIRYMIYRASRKKTPVNRKIGVDFWVFPSEELAQAFSKRNADKIKRKELIGVKGFDGKYYIVRTDAYYNVLPIIIETLKKGEKCLEDIAKEIRASQDFVRAVLELAREEGVVYEVKQGVYKYAG